MKPIYEPKGKAKEYGELALNIYTGCPHKCFYCYAPNVLHKEKNSFHDCVKAREGILEATRKQIENEKIKNKLIHLCFTCDPYPIGYDTTPTREIIKVIKESGNNVQILTKNGRDAMRDFDLLDENDWFGITYAGYDGPCYDKNYIPVEESGAGSPHDRILALKIAYDNEIKTWVSVEPVLNAKDALDFILFANYVDLWKIGKMNYHASDINWKEFGEQAMRILASKPKGNNYYIKEDLRKEIER